MEIDRARGALLGLACGDAVGTTVEFSPRDTFDPVTDMVGGGPFGLAPGEWTDDTSMALCLADSLLTRGTFDAVDQLQRYLRWRREGYLSSTGQCFDVGGTVRQALDRFASTGDPASGPTDPSTAGNGSLMRLAPVVLFYYPDRERIDHYAAESSRTTHGAEEAVASCRMLATVLNALLGGADPRERAWCLAARTVDVGQALGCGKRRVPDESQSRDQGQWVCCGVSGGCPLVLSAGYLLRRRCPDGGEPRRRRRHDGRRVRSAGGGVLRRRRHSGALAWADRPGRPDSGMGGAAGDGSAHLTVPGFII